MSEKELIEILQPHYREILQKDDLILTRELSALDVDSWDSLNHILLIVKCEEIFSIKFKSSELVSLSNLGEFLDLLISKIE
tara:strand:- start:56 stop:298 length:243 start_codon:yes stop_codon:yes gene_type:complete